MSDPVVKAVVALIQGFIEDEFGIDFPFESTAVYELADGIIAKLQPPRVDVIAKGTAGAPMIMQMED